MKWQIEYATLLREEPLYADPQKGVLTCRNCRSNFKRQRSETSPCCPKCTLMMSRHLAKLILDDEAFDELAKSEAKLPAIDAHAPSPTPMTSGMRWIALMPVVNSSGWQVARGPGADRNVIELLFSDPVSAQKYADRYTRGKGPGRVLEIELLDAAERNATQEERHQRAERLSFKYFEEERQLRPVAAKDPDGEQAAAESRRAERNAPQALARMVKAGPMSVPPGSSSDIGPGHPCRRCNTPLTVPIVFCVGCMKIALDTLATFVVEHSQEGPAL